jgi:hypothetical protein
VKPARASSSFGRTLPRKHSQSTRLIEVGEEGIDLRQQLGAVQVRVKPCPHRQVHVTFQRRRQPRQVVFQFSRVAGYTPADCRKLAAQTINRIFAARHMCALFSRLIYCHSGRHDDADQ